MNSAFKIIPALFCGMKIEEKQTLADKLPNAIMAGNLRNIAAKFALLVHHTNHNVVGELVLFWE